ncbi:hypothetical protein Y032_0036g3175 [Ancylostoma ceylanicum]|uniref:Hyaluronidase n=1 Tax=Ancylostoma ceylanicum TaxID=53326 RepID=A0A016ULV9_9BILA|nr:hypothetical protein Y032_0036g3175 [Ancylostoma ceylanicum]
MWLLLTFPLLLQWMRISAEDALPVYWNVPSASCKKMGVNIPLNEFEIIHNKGDEFLGEKIVIFYEKKFGKCPYYKDYDPKQPINGGLPQVRAFYCHPTHTRYTAKALKRIHIITNKIEISKVNLYWMRAYEATVFIQGGPHEV